MTPKQKVLKRYPGAFAHCLVRWSIWRPSSQRYWKANCRITMPRAESYATGFPTARQAWADAARRIKS